MNDTDPFALAARQVEIDREATQRRRTRTAPGRALGQARAGSVLDAPPGRVVERFTGLWLESGAGALDHQDLGRIDRADRADISPAG